MPDTSYIGIILSLKIAGIVVSAICGILLVLTKPHKEITIPPVIIGGQARVKKRITREGIVYVSLIIVGVLVTVSAYVMESLEKQSEKEESRKENLSTREDIHGIREVLTTNRPSSATQLALLDYKDKEETKRGEVIKEIVNTEGVTLEVLGEEWQHVNALLENQRVRAEIQKEQSESQNKQAQEQELETNLQIERLMADEYAPIFDGAIDKLRRMLEGLGNRTGEKIFSDFPSTPTIYSPGFIKDGRIVDGEYFIRLGTNDEWKFWIRTYKYSRENSYSTPMVMIFNYDYKWNCLIKPIENTQITNLSICFGTSSNTVIRETRLLMNYTEAVEEALLGLIAVQNGQFPPTTNKADLGK